MTVHQKIRYEKRLMLSCFKNLDEAVVWITDAMNQLVKDGVDEVKMELDRNRKTVTISGFKDT